MDIYRKRKKIQTLFGVIQRDHDIFIPGGSTQIHENDKISMTGSPKHMERFLSSIGIFSREIKDILIVGGGRIAFYLIQSLLETGMNVKIIEKNREKCLKLVEKFPEICVIEGDGTDHELLISESLEKQDAFVALTDNDEANIIISMFSSNHGVQKVLPKVNRISLGFLTETLGLNNIITPKNITANQIVQYVRAMQNSVGSNVESLLRILDDRVEILEFRIRENCSFLDRPLKDIHFRNGIIIACITHRGVSRVANGNSMVRLQDTVIVISTFMKLRRILTMYWHRALRHLNWRIILNLLGYVMIAAGALMVLPMIVSLLYQEQAWQAFLWSIVICVITSIPFMRISTKKTFYFAKDGLIAVGLSWLFVSAIGALPFYLSNEIPSYIDALFETVSGFTTTGSSILTDVEALPNGLLFWRSFTHWIGGMGVLVFVLALLPKSNERTMHIMRAEVPGPTIGKLVPRLRKSAMILYLFYMLLTVIEFLLLLLGKMPLFDALVNTFGTAGTGGFAIKNLSIGFYNNAYYEAVITIFMLLFGVNFNLYYFLMIRDYRQAFHDEELCTYFGIVAAAVICIIINIYPIYNSLAECFRYSSFQVASIITTTGYSTADFNLWPTLSKTILLLLTVVGASAGSTGGGVKVSRMLIIVKRIKLDIQRLIHPQKVNAITLNGRIVQEETVNQIICCYILIMAVCFLIVSLDNFDIETTISSVFACISNIDPGLGLCGPMGNFSMFSDLSKLFLTAAMLIGRLEIFPIIIFLSPLFHMPTLRKGSREESV